MKNIFLEISYTKCVRKTITRLFSKKSELSISLYQHFKVIYILFQLFAKLRTVESALNWAAYHLLLPHIKLFKKTKRGLELASLLHFMHDFWRKSFLLLYFIIWPNFNVWLPLIREILGNMCIVIAYCIIILSVGHCDTVDFRVRRPIRPRSFLTTIIKKLLKYLLAFMNFYQHTKNQFVSFIFPWHTANFRVLRTECLHPFSTMPTLIFFNQLLLSINLYQHAKNQVFSTFYSRDIDDLKTL